MAFFLYFTEMPPSFFVRFFKNRGFSPSVLRFRCVFSPLSWGAFPIIGALPHLLTAWLPVRFGKLSGCFPAKFSARFR